MPSIRRRNKIRAEYTRLEYYAVASGHDFFVRFPTEDDWRDAWDEMKDALLPAFIEQCPGQRPWCWWKFEAPERRRAVDGKPHPFEDPERQAHLDDIAATLPPEERDAYYHTANELTYGLPRFIATKSMALREYESQPGYLDRLGLLTHAEYKYFAQLGDEWTERDFDEKRFDAKAWAKGTGAPL
jgi:hypothetical protein